MISLFDNFRRSAQGRIKKESTFYHVCALLSLVSLFGLCIGVHPFFGIIDIPWQSCDLKLQVFCMGYMCIHVLHPALTSQIHILWLPRGSCWPIRSWHLSSSGAFLTNQKQTPGLPKIEIVYICSYRVCQWLLCQADDHVDSYLAWRENIILNTCRCRCTTHWSVSLRQC